MNKISVCSKDTTYEIKYSDYLTEKETKEMFVGIYDFLTFKNTRHKISKKLELYDFNGVQAYVRELWANTL